MIIVTKMSTTNIIDPNLMTLTRYVLDEQKTSKGATGELSQLLNAIQTSVKIISSAVRRAGLTELFGSTNESNVQGEDVKKLDVVSNEIFINVLSSSYTVALLISEENQNAINIPVDKKGKYIVAFDPLDGSSNIDCLISIGSIFLVLRRADNAIPTLHDVLSKGGNLVIVAAGYVLYGSATMIVLSIGKGVHSFMLDPSIGEFILTEYNMKIPSRGNIYSINEGNTHAFQEPLKQYIAIKKDPLRGKPYSARYVGSMVADIHRTLKYGGIFMYPPTRDAPKGKLRVLYECMPMAFLIIQAGGLASNGDISILDIQVGNLHERTPIYIGSKEDVKELLDFFKQSK